MPKDRDQLTPDDPEDAGRLRPLRAADKVAEGPDPEGPLADRRGSDPAAAEEVGGDGADNYR